MTQSHEEPDGDRNELLDRKTRRARATIVAERLARLGAALISLALLFLALAWGGFFAQLSAPFRLAGAIAFGLCALALLGAELRRGLPTRRDAIRRIDAQDRSGLRPAASLEDKLAGAGAAESTRTLWAAHRRRLEQVLAALRLAPPKPGLARRDPYALRLAALLAAIAAGLAAGDERASRLAAAFDWRGAGFALQTERFDAWLDPPPYTGRAQIVLNDADFGGSLEAPVNSILHVRPASAAHVDGALTPLQGRAEKTAQDEKSFKLEGPARLFAPGGGDLALTATPDEAPTINLTEPPRLNLRGSMTLLYETSDDYGVIGATALFSAPTARRTLYPPPQLPLDLPKDEHGRGAAQTLLDLSDSPWAGAKAAMVLEARDEGGNTGRSAEREITLPQRRFTKPLARAFAEQRRALALDPDGRDRVREALAALTQTPDFLAAPSSVFFGLRLALRGLYGPRTDAELRETADLLWAMALNLEDGDLAQAERDLRDAERKLNEVLARGADEKEIDKLNQELRDALDKFLQNATRNAAQGEKAEQGGGDGREISKSDLDRLMDEIAQAIKSGDTAQAQKLLSELAEIMENLQTSQQGGGKGGESAKAMSEIDQLAREQQQLRDETFQGVKDGGEDPNARAQKDGAPRPQKDRAANGKSDHRNEQRQRELRERLERQRDALQRSPDGAPAELGAADDAMEDAERALSQGPSGAGAAVDAQGRALQALRQGADELARRADGESDSEDGPQRRGAGRRQTGRDPLGRRTGYDSRARYDPLGLPPAQRARRLQDELRRRLGQPERPAEELDYLQRLLPR